MSKTNEIDVLTVMDSLISFLNSWRDEQAAYVAECAAHPFASSRHEYALRSLVDHEWVLAEAIKVRANVADLVAADRALDAANNALATTDPQSEDAETMSAMRAHRDHCRARRAAALADFGGQS